MKKLLFLLFFFIFAVFGQGEGWFVDCSKNPLPKDPTWQSKCQVCVDAGFVADLNAQCVKANLFPWVAYGGDGNGGRWETTISQSNNKIKGGSLSGEVAIGFGLLLPDGQLTPPPSYFLNSKSKIEGLGQAVEYPLFPGQSVETTISYPASCPDATLAGCVPDTNRLITGSVMITYTSQNPEVLKDLAKSQVRFFYRKNGGARQWQVSQTADEPSKEWLAFVSETYDKSGNWETMKNTSIAISNPTWTPVLVDVTITDQRMRYSITRQIQLNKWTTRAYMLVGPSGSGLFRPDEVFSNGEDFNGTIRFKVAPPNPVNPPGGKVNVLVFQLSGDSLGNLSPQRIE